MFISLYVYNSDIVFLHLHVEVLQVLQQTPYWEMLEQSLMSGHNHEHVLYISVLSVK